MRIVISGASGGLGAALAAEFAGRGSAVHGCGTRRAAGACDQIDVADRYAVSRWADRVGARPVDVVIANAAVALRTKPVDETTPAEFRFLFNVNVLGVVNLFAAFAPYATERCTFIAVSSRWGVAAPRAGQAAYCSSKFAVEGFVSAWRQEIGARQRVYALDPGAGIDTPMMSRMTPPGAWPRPPEPAQEWAARAAAFITGLTEAAQGPLHVQIPRPEDS